MFAFDLFPINDFFLRIYEYMIIELQWTWGFVFLKKKNFDF